MAAVTVHHTALASIHPVVRAATKALVLPWALRVEKEVSPEMSILSAAGLISTEGEKAHAVFAQSIGGGGGNGGWANAVVFKSASAKVGIGGEGGQGGLGGFVSVRKLCKLFTTGMSAAGIFAQSVGGGGGTGVSTHSVGLGYQTMAVVL